uniref:Pyridine nucleotide-disulfide oxidoreductase family protein n=1 Tax=Rhizobium rhizogenes TaxID=359 RepID=A0A7S4ZTC1_RHIRH|nr:SidA/IucD/PvdA family monooxygenase [Rhizobium rhizogenes]QCL09178.1 pyridine nucleotide-disulfide oxidoreductase family protein [Rhizobium rhizogenes]QCL09812.1 pyridine nucleotide-disulfide oxidoreductase family protein [Rhizobium rhizogenes]
MNEHSNAMYDCIGVGIGPSNLSLASLCDPISDLSLKLLEQRESFIWHQGMLLPEAFIQVPFLKDLVSLVDPTNRYSFINFLRENKRLYHFLNADFHAVNRREFNQYLQWVCRHLDTLQFSSRVMSIDFVGHFQVRTQTALYRARNVVIGIGRSAAIPAFAVEKLGPEVVHSSDFLSVDRQVSGKRVVVVGGGQSGAEIFLELLSKPEAELPRSCTWLSRRSNFFPIDDSPFVNEYFNPGYSEYFFRSSGDVRRLRLSEQKLASDGISLVTLKRIYQAVYDLRHISTRSMAIEMRPSTSVTDMRMIDKSWTLSCRSTDTGNSLDVKADIVVLATGYKYEPPHFIEPLIARLDTCGGEIALNDDFSAVWNGPKEHKLFLQNASREQWGVADPNLSLMSWRSAKIINSIMGRQVYALDEEASYIEWSAPQAPSLEERRLA